jgi:excisionase family DNA binding protein
MTTYNPALSVELLVGSEQYADGRSSARRRCGVATIDNKLDLSDIVTTVEAAELAGCSDGHIRKLCIAGEIVAKKHGREWLVSAAAAKALRGSLPRSLGAAKKSEPVARRPRRK